MWFHLRSALIYLALLVPFAAFAQAPTGDKALQAANPAPEIPRFYAESRQILVEAEVWDAPNQKSAADTSLIPTESQERLPNAGASVLHLPKWWPTPARGLTLKDFRVFDNGVEQKINFLKETDFSTSNLPDQWWTGPDEHGTWASLEPNEFQDARATYLIGYAPASLQSGECRSIQVSVEGREVDLNRIQYCGLRDCQGADRTPEATNLETQMRSFANSAARQAIKVSLQTFEFWSSGVLHLLAETSSEGKSPGQASMNFTYVVEVHDSRAPTTIQIATEFHLPTRYWEMSDCRKENRTVQVLGMVYSTTGVLATEFADSAPCLNPHVMNSTPMKYALKHSLLPEYVAIPTRFDTQVELPVGDYELRVVVSDGKNFGRAQVPLRVKGFEGHHLTISDVVLAGIGRDASWVAREAASVSPAPVIPTPLVSRNIQFFPAVDMHLPRHSPLSFYFEIYELQLKTEAVAVYYGIRISDLQTGSLAMNTGPISAAEWMSAGNTVIPIGLKVATDKLKKGSYRLEVQASDSAGRETEWRQAAFTIE